MGADWAAGAVGSRAECAAGRPLRAREGKRGRAGGRRQAGAPPDERRLRPRAVLERVGAADVAGRPVQGAAMERREGLQGCRRMRNRKKTPKTYNTCLT